MVATDGSFLLATLHEGKKITREEVYKLIQSHPNHLNLIVEYDRGDIYSDKDRKGEEITYDTIPPEFKKTPPALPLETPQPKTPALELLEEVFAALKDPSAAVKEARRRFEEDGQQDRFDAILAQIRPPSALNQAANTLADPLINSVELMQKLLNPQIQDDLPLENQIPMNLIIDLRETFETPYSNLIFASLEKLFGGKTAQTEHDLILIHLDQLVKINGNKIKPEGALREVLRGIGQWINLSGNQNLKIGFVMDSDRGADIAHTLARRYGVADRILFTARTPLEAKNKSTGFKVAFVVTMFPQAWRKIVNNLIGLFTQSNEITISGALAKELRGLIGTLGFVENGVKSNWLTGELTFEKKSLKSDHLENLNTSEPFLIQA